MTPPRSEDRVPKSEDNPRHAVWIEDAQGLRKITAMNPGEPRINVGGVVYEHTRELKPNGPWVYTVETP